MAIPPWLDSTWITTVHDASLRILAEIGVRVDHTEMRDQLAASGCSVTADRVRIPPDLVESTLATIPSSPVIYATRGTAHLDLGGGGVSGMLCGSVPYVLDFKSGRRRAQCADNIAAIRLADALPHIGLPNGLFSVEDVPAALAEVVEFEILLRNTSKPFNASIMTSVGAKYVIEMATAVSGSLEALQTRPFFLCAICPMSPLHYTEETSAALMVLAEHGIPVQIVTMPAQGVTSPITLGGALSQQNAELLAGIVIAYQIQPGLPIVYVGRISTADMRTGHSVWGNPQIGLASVYSVQLAQHYGLPSNVYGFGSSSKTIDTQTGYERTLNTLLPALWGATILGGVGSLDNLTLAALELLVIDNEIMSMVEYMRAGCGMDEEHLAHEAIQAAMDGIPFMGQMHTVRHLRDGSLWKTRINELRTYEEWEADGGRDIIAVARAEAETILERHEVVPLPEDVSREIRAIVSHAKRELLG